MKRYSGSVERWSSPMFRELLGAASVLPKEEKARKGRQIRELGPSFPVETEEKLW
jgi:hypothetical protein